VQAPQPRYERGLVAAERRAERDRVRLLVVHLADDVVDRLVALRERLLRDDLPAELGEAHRERLADVLEVAEQVVRDDDGRVPALRLVRELRSGGALVLGGIAVREAKLALRREANRAQLVRAETRRDGELAGVQELLR